jgi:hypothetical protein
VTPIVPDAQAGLGEVRAAGGSRAFTSGTVQQWVDRSAAVYLLAGSGGTPAMRRALFTEADLYRKNAMVQGRREGGFELSRAAFDALLLPRLKALGLVQDAEAPNGPLAPGDPFKARWQQLIPQGDPSIPITLRSWEEIK